jgi:hypothetical protein
MNRLPYIIILLTISVSLSCSYKKSTDWQKMDCGLYMSPKGDIGFPSYPERANIDYSELQGEECPNYFLTTFGYDDTTQLKYVIDTLTFKYIGLSFYKDTNKTYSYYPMCDGGYFNLSKFENSKLKILNDQYYIHDTTTYHYLKGPIYADLKTFAASSKHKQLACDKDYFYSFGEKIEELELLKQTSPETIEDVKNLQNFNDYSFIDTDTNFFSTGSMLYWQWDRDSSWMTFESNEHSKTILMQLEGGIMSYTDRLGLCFIKEYDDFIHFQNRWISGCCTPPDMVFLDKSSGKEINRISNMAFIWHSWEDDYVIYFSDSLYNVIEYFDLKNNNKRETNLPLEKGTSKLSLAVANEYYPNDIFNAPKIKGNHLLLEYHYQHPDFKDSLVTDVVRIKKSLR